MPTIGILSRRVLGPNTNDREKGHRLVRYLHCTQGLHLVLHYEGLNVCKYDMDVRFVVHLDFRYHSVGVMFMHEKSGGMASTSTKQKLNTRSSTNSKLVAVDDFLPKIMWVKTFLEEQGVKLNQDVLLR